MKDLSNQIFHMNRSMHVKYYRHGYAVQINGRKGRMPLSWHGRLDIAIYSADHINDLLQTMIFYATKHFRSKSLIKL